MTRYQLDILFNMLRNHLRM